MNPLRCLRYASVLDVSRFGDGAGFFLITVGREMKKGLLRNAAGPLCFERKISLEDDLQRQLDLAGIGCGCGDLAGRSERLCRSGTGRRLGESPDVLR